MPYDGEVTAFQRVETLPAPIKPAPQKVQDLPDEVIDRAIEIIERGWTTGALAAKGRWGDKASIFDPAAERFCMVGALQKASYELTGNAKGFTYRRALSRVAKKISVTNWFTRLNRTWRVVYFNDEQAGISSEVVNTLKRAKS